MSPDERLTARTLCIISLTSNALPVTLCLLAELLTFSDAFCSFAAFSAIVGLIVGVSLMIYVRVHYPAYTFGKIVMWIYIACAATVIVLYLVVVYACSVACNNFFASIETSIESCRKMG